MVGGVEKVLLAHRRLLSNAGYQVEELPALEVFSAAPQPDFRDLQLPAFQARLSHLRATLLPALRSFGTVFVHNVCTMPFDLSLTALLWEAAHAFPETRFFGWIHDLCSPLPAAVREASLPWTLLTQAHPRITYVAVSSARRREFLEITGAPQDRCAVIPNGIDPEADLDLTPRVAQLAREHRWTKRSAVLLHPARLLGRKNIEYGLLLTAEMRDLGWDPLLLVTCAPDARGADGADLMPALERLRRERRLEDHAVFLNHGAPLDEADLSSLFRIADAVILPSSHEGFGLPILEAALHHIPAFCTDVDPLNKFPWAIPFPRDASLSENARLIMRQLHSSSAIQNRKSLFQNYTWPALWQNFLAPLLPQNETPFAA